MSEAKRIDFHTHSLLSDGVLLPSEMLRRVSVLGYEALAITDHVDAGNMEVVILSLRRVLAEQVGDFGTQLLVGVEITHVAPQSIDRLARRARAMGAEVVVVHGESVVEPVAPGTNHAALESGAVDILAHPGLLSLEDARLAAGRGCYVEITTRQGHCLANGHVARMCMLAGAKMLVNSDAHAPSDLVTLEFARRVAAGAGLGEEAVLAATVTNPRELASRILAERRRQEVDKRALSL